MAMRRVGASIDVIAQFGSTVHDDAALQALCPEIGAELDAVVQEVRRWTDPAWARLSIRPEDLKEFRWPCDFCDEVAVLSPGGDGLVLDVRSNDGAGSTTVISHREIASSCGVTPHDHLPQHPHRTEQGSA
ncbi:hypothetical protein KRMM14A1259_17460 [Krasilnikovia sp. MM14-A1259]